MTRIPLTLGRHYLLIDSPISFYLVDNEENSVYRPSGVWQLDTWKLLPEKYQKDHPVYTLSIDYDESKLADGKEVLIRESDIDLGDGVAGVSGQAVMLTGINDSLLPIPVAVSDLPDNQKVNVSNFPDVQKVNVQNNPTEIAVNNFPDTQKVYVNNFSSISTYLKSINVSNFPDIQKVRETSNFYCHTFPDSSGEPFDFASFISWFQDYTGIIDYLIFFTKDTNPSSTYFVKSFSFPAGNGTELVAFIGLDSNSNRTVMKACSPAHVSVMVFAHENLG